MLKLYIPSSHLDGVDGNSALSERWWTQELRLCSTFRGCWHPEDPSRTLGSSEEVVKRKWKSLFSQVQLVENDSVSS